jgi:hypothetical protein
MLITVHPKELFCVNMSNFIFPAASLLPDCTRRMSTPISYFIRIRDYGRSSRKTCHDKLFASSVNIWRHKNSQQSNFKVRRPQTARLLALLLGASSTTYCSIGPIMVFVFVEAFRLAGDSVHCVATFQIDVSMLRTKNSLDLGGGFLTNHLCRPNFFPIRRSSSSLWRWCRIYCVQEDVENWQTLEFFHPRCYIIFATRFRTLLIALDIFRYSMHVQKVYFWHPWPTGFSILSATLW